MTPKRRGRLVENDQHAAFVRRVIAAHSRRVAAGDIDAIRDMTSITAELGDAIGTSFLSSGEAVAYYAMRSVARFLISIPDSGPPISNSRVLHNPP